MNPNDDFSTFVHQNRALLREYVDTRTELFKLQAIKLTSKTIGFLIVLGIVGTVAMFVSFFLGMSLSYWFSAILGSQIAGFAATGGIFLLLLILIILLRKQLFFNPLTRLIIRETLQDLEEPTTE